MAQAAAQRGRWLLAMLTSHASKLYQIAISGDWTALYIQGTEGLTRRFYEIELNILILSLWHKQFPSLLTFLTLNKTISHSLDIHRTHVTSLQQIMSN